MVVEIKNNKIPHLQFYTQQNKMNMSSAQWPKVEKEFCVLS